MEKENPNLITVFICFLRSGLRFTRYDTNNVGLAFIEEIKKHNPNFKPVKVTQRERDQEYTVNAYPKEFEQLINSLIEEYRIKHKLEYRLKKPRTSGGRGGFNRGGGNRTGGYGQNRDQRSSGSYNRPRRDDQGGSFSPRRENDNRSGEYRPTRTNPDQSGQSGYRPRRSNDDQPNQSGYRPRRDDQSGQGGFQRGNQDSHSGQGGFRPRSNNADNRGQGDGYRPRGDQGVGGDRFTPNRYPKDKDENAGERPKRPRRDPSE